MARASGSPIYATVTAPAVTVGGQAVQVLFAGSAPGYAGLYQVNFQIPQNAPTGDSVPITIAPAVTVAGTSPDTATVAIQ